MPAKRTRRVLALATGKLDEADCGAFLWGQRHSGEENEVERSEFSQTDLIWTNLFGASFNSARGGGKALARPSASWLWARGRMLYLLHVRTAAWRSTYLPPPIPAICSCFATSETWCLLTTI